VRDDAGILPRAILAVVAVLLLVGVLGSAVAPRDVTNPSTERVVRPPAPAPPPVARQVQAALSAGDGGRVRARVGDAVIITVHAPGADVAELEALGISAPVDGGSPAVLAFVAAQPGRFAVTLRWAGRRVGVLDVTG
jgi:hypothetical protein